MTTLVIVKASSEPSKLRFRQLHGQYDLAFWVLDQNVPHDTQSEQIVDFSKRHKLHLDSVVGFSEETALLAAALATRMGTVYTSPQSICRAQHKAVFAQVAQQVDGCYPPTITITDPNQTSIELEYPVFIKPSRGSVSECAYRVDSREDLARILKTVFGKKRNLRFWQYACETYLKDPPRVDSFLVQPFIEAPQFTVDGLVFRNTVQILGITESIYDERRESFQRFDLLVDFPQNVQRKLHTLLEKVVRELGFNNSNFNVEFFLTGDNDIILIEFNTRASAVFTNLYNQRYRNSLIEMMIQISLGREPDTSLRDKPQIASSCVLRTREDCEVRSVPTPEEIEYLKVKYDLIDIDLLVEAGKRLSDYKQDSYSYRYAFVDLAGDSCQDVLDRLEGVKKELRFELEPVA